MSELEQVLNEYHSLGINQQLDYDKFYLYSIITHSTAIEGSTVTEVEAQLLFDEGITSSKRTLAEQIRTLSILCLIIIWTILKSRLCSTKSPCRMIL